MIDLAGDIAAAGTALAGLLLVFLGTLIASYDAFDPASQPAVRGKFRRRGWLGFTGFVLALAAAALSLGGKWSGVQVWVLLAFISLGLSFAVVFVAAILLVSDIR